MTFLLVFIELFADPFKFFDQQVQAFFFPFHIGFSQNGCAQCHPEDGEGNYANLKAQV